MIMVILIPCIVGAASSFLLPWLLPDLPLAAAPMSRRSSCSCRSGLPLGLPDTRNRRGTVKSASLSAASVMPPSLQGHKAGISERIAVATVWSLQPGCTGHKSLL